jgi:hypothetical protein
MELTRPHRPPREIPALDLGALVQRHAAGFGRVRACGDWSDPRFRRVAGPLLLAFARHAHLLPTAFDEPDGSLLDAGLDACSDAVLESAMAVAVEPGQVLQAGRPSTSERRRHRSGAQDAVVLHALAPWVVAAVSRWQVLDRDGHPIMLAEQPLSDRLETAGVPRSWRPGTMPRYRIRPGESLPAVEAARPATRALGMVLLLRALPASALAAACASSPPLLEAALALSMRGTAGDAAKPLPVAGMGPDPMGGAREEAPFPGKQSLRDAMRALIASGQWTVNVRRSRLWFLDGRLYLVWKTAAEELSRRLAVDGTSLLPTLVRYGIVTVRAGDAAGATPEASCAMRVIRTPYTEALSVVELTDADDWLRWTPSRSPDNARPDHARPDSALRCA